MSLVLLFASLASGLAFNSTRSLPDDLPEDSNKIKNLTPEQARRLSDGFQDPFLSLDRLHTLDADTAKVLADMKVKYLSLNGLTTLSPEAAQALAKSPATHLYLGGVPALDVAARVHRVDQPRSALVHKGVRTTPHRFVLGPARTELILLKLARRSHVGKLAVSGRS